MSVPKRLLISRTDAIGDVVLTLPLTTILKQYFPDVIIGFLGRSYTKSVIESCAAVDMFVDADDFLNNDTKAIVKQGWDSIVHVFPRKDIAWKALRVGIRQRIGTSSRPYHLLTCNKLVKLSRRHSPLHEAQLNMKLLAPLGIDANYSTDALGGLFSLNKIAPLSSELQELLNPGKRHIILHPKSQGSAREWGLEHFRELIDLLPKDRYQIFVSGTAAEAKLLRPLFDSIGNLVTDISGKMDLKTFISFIAAGDAMVAASTGPLHIAAALGKVALGLYPSIRPMHRGRWGALGPHATAFELLPSCNLCRKTPESCSCIQNISALKIAEHILDALP